ncbi:MAG: C-GCAxxG-C-C family (seleno)protein [Bacillota bacterium]|jgi:C_GCAxxG_C_C family probable redox protein
MINAIRDRAEAHFRSGYNCAEAVFLAATETFGLSLGPKDVRLATGFGGGLGLGEVCGALSGAVLALGAAAGRVNSAQNQEDFKALREKIVTAFEEEFQSICCRDLRTEEREDCVAYVRKAAAALARVFENLLAEDPGLRKTCPQLASDLPHRKANM